MIIVPKKGTGKTKGCEEMAEVLNHETRAFKAKTSDGNTVIYRVHWQGYIDIGVQEYGGPWTLSHPYDDRRCHWNINGRITRRVAVVFADQEFFDDTVTQVFTHSHAGEGSDFVLSSLHPQNCNDCAPRRDSDYQGIKNVINSAVAEVADADLPKIMESIKGKPGVVEVNI